MFDRQDAQVLEYYIALDDGCLNSDHATNPLFPLRVAFASSCAIPSRILSTSH